MTISFNYEGVTYTASASLEERTYIIEDINPAHKGLKRLMIDQGPSDMFFIDEFVRMAYISATQALG